MPSVDFIPYAQNSAQAYLDYCRTNNKSISKVDVLHIRQGPKNDLFVMSLSAMNYRFNLESAFIQIVTSQKHPLPFEAYENAEFHYISKEYVELSSYDSKKNEVTVKVHKKLCPIFEDYLTANPHRVHFVHDMTFLIQSVCSWYAREHRSLFLPKDPSSEMLDFFTEHFDDARLSKAQRAAVETALSHGVSYIWGPPGTGKTYTLAHTVLSYVMNQKTVLIVAPTNNALDQSLRTIIKVMESQGVDFHVISRLGIPTPAFEKSYPDICSNHTLVASRNIMEARLNKLKEELFVSSRSSQFFDLVREFQENASTYEAATEALHPLADDHKPERENGAAPISELQQSASDSLDRIIEISKKLFTKYESIDSTAAAIAERIEKYSSCRPVSTIQEEIENTQKHCQSLDRAISADGEHRYIVACTADYLFLHYEYMNWEFSNNGMLPQHIFIDEAAYLPLIKTAPVFTMNVPVTFCGDHKQLPPVCEVDEEKIIRNRDYAPFFIWSQSALHFTDIFTYDIEDLYQAYSVHGDMLNKNLATAFLPDSHRFGNNLAQILDEFVYRNGFRGTAFDTDIIVLDAPTNGMFMRGRENPMEIKAISRYMSTHQVGAHSIITPYKDQKSLLNKEFNTAGYPGTVETIHASQGQEWYTVFISPSDHDHSMYYCNSRTPLGEHVLNTAVSRAVHKIIIACDYDFWIGQKDEQLLGRLCDSCTEYVPYFD